MAIGQRSEESKRKNVPSVGRGKSKTIADANRRQHNETRRLKYQADSDYRRKQQKAARESYRKKNPRAPDTGKGLKTPPEQKEVMRIGDEEFEEGMVQVKCYTISSMALALGKTRMTVGTWIKAGVIPPPVLRDENTDRFKYYSFGEVKIINRVLNQHFREFDYLAASHETTIHQLWQEIEGYRQEYI